MIFAPFVVALLMVTPASVHGLRFTAQSFEASRSAHHEELPELALVSSGSAAPLQRELLKELRTLSVAVPVLDHMRSAPGEVLRGIRSDQVFEDSVTRLRHASDIRRPESGLWARRVLEILFSEAYLAPEQIGPPPEPARRRRPIRFEARPMPGPLAASREGSSRSGWERLDPHRHEVIREP